MRAEGPDPGQPSARPLPTGWASCHPITRQPDSPRTSDCSTAPQPPQARVGTDTLRARALLVGTPSRFPRSTSSAGSKLVPLRELSPPCKGQCSGSLPCGHSRPAAPSLGPERRLHTRHSGWCWLRTGQQAAWEEIP